MRLVKYPVLSSTPDAAFRGFSILSPITAALILFTQPGHASEWTLKPSLNFTENYSSNILRATRGNEQADWVTQFTPNLSLNSTGPRLKLDSTYQMQNLRYAKNNQRNTTRHQLNAHAHAELINEQLFMDGTATISQQNTNPLASQAPNNFNPTGNLAQVVNLSASPYLKYRLEGLANGEARYTHAAVSSNATGLANTQTDSILLQLSSGHSFTTLHWGAQYNKQKSAYGNALQTINSEMYSGNLAYMVTPRFSLNATAGQEKSDYIALGKRPSGPSYSAGFSWAPSQRTNLTANYGHRFFGPSYKVEAKHHSRRTVWTLSYNEDITTTQAQFLTGQNVLQGPTNFLSNRVFLQKRLQVGATLTGRKDTLIINLFNSLRQAQTAQTQNLALLGAANVALSDNTNQLGATSSWHRKINPGTNADLTVGYTKSSFSGLGVSSYNKNVQLRVTTKLQADLSYSVSVQHNQYNSSLANSAMQETSMTASLLMQF